MRERTKIFLKLLKTEPVWAMIVVAIVLSMALGVFCSFHSYVYGTLAFLSGISLGLLTNGVLETLDMIEEISNSCFPKDGDTKSH